MPLRLVSLPERGKPDTPRLWFNPEHVTSMAPVLERFGDADGEHIALSVELKLQGLPVTRNWLATCADGDAADIAWDGFLRLVEGREAPQP